MTAPAHLLTIARPVEAVLSQFLAERKTDWMAIDPIVEPAFDSLSALTLAPAKRLRAAFCYWGSRIAGADDVGRRVVDAGAALELLQAFALMHDDVMDRSERRRGRATAHVDHQDAHIAAGWAGDPAHYGHSAAVLVGNLAHVYADEFLAIAAEGDPEIWAQWNALRTEVNLGQFLDLNGAARRTRDRDEIERILHFKSVTYTVVRPLHIGAAIGGRQAEFADRIDDLGTPLGQAFQLRDDLLGALGDSAHTGKPVGDDIREGKPTPLLAAAWAEATPAQRNILDHVGGVDLDDDEVAAVLDVMTDVGAIEEIEHRIRLLADDAASAAATLDLDPTVETELLELITFVAFRTL